MNIKVKISSIALCLILLLCAATGTAMSGCSGRDKSAIYEADNNRSDFSDGEQATFTDAYGNTVSWNGESEPSVGSGGMTQVPSETIADGIFPGETITHSDGTVIPVFPGSTLPDIPTVPDGALLPTRPDGSVIPVFPSASGDASGEGNKENDILYPGVTKDPSGQNTENKTDSSSATVPAVPSGGGNGNSSPAGTGGSTGTTVSPGGDTTVPSVPVNPPVPGTVTVQSSPSAGFANIVVFVQTESTSSPNYFADKTDGINKRWNTDERSLTSFLKMASNGKFTVNNIFPQYDPDKNIYVTYTVPDFFVTGSYSSDTSLLSAVIKQLAVDPSVKIDCTGDGIIDNLTVVVHKDNYSSSSKNEVLWPHRGVYAGSDMVNGKYIRNYNILNTEIFTNIINSYGVISHEFMHSLGYPDLYKNTGSDMPVGMWDIMASSNDYMSYPLAYLRNRISGWTNVSTVTKTSSRLTLSAQNSPTGTHAYIIKNPSMSESEFFVVEYRRLGNGADGQFTLDSRIPCYYAPAGKNGGIIIYRVNTNIDGLSNQGTANAIYVFRPGVSNELSCGSDLKNSALSAESGRTSFGSTDPDAGIADNALTYSNGINSGIVIKNVGSALGSTISFDVEFPSGNDGWSEEAAGAANSSAADVSLTIDPTGRISVVNPDLYGAGLYVSTANGGAWTKTKPLTDGILNAKSIVWNSKQYILYMDYSFNLYMASFSSGSMSGKRLVASSVQDYAVTAGSDGIYIAYTNSQLDSKLTVKKFNGSFSVLLDKKNIGNAGTLSAAYAGNSLYVAYRAWSDGNAVKILRVSDGKYINTSGISGNSFSMTADGGTLYLAVGTQNASGYMQVYKCTSGAASFTRVGANICQGDIYELDIAVKGGRIFAVCVNQTTNKTEVYSFDGSSWSRFGSPLEGGTILDSEIELSGGKVIVAYVSNNSVYVRSRTY